MTLRKWVLAGAALIVAAAVAALGVVLLTQGPAERETVELPEESAGIEARALLSPRIVLFGDTVRAVVDVTADSRLVDPDSVRVVPAFTPWEIIGRPERDRRDSGAMAFLRTTFVLRCLSSPCVPPGQSAPLEFNPARVTFTAPDAKPRTRNSVQASWPVLLVYSRFAAANLDGSQTVDGIQTASAPWRADVLSLPNASYRLQPVLLIGLLLGSAALFGLGAVGLLYIVWPRRAPAPPPEPEPEPVEPLLSPLEQALVLLEEAARADGGADQRRALELVAEELELADWGDPDLARSARVLAWSEDVPPHGLTSALAARVRSALEERRANVNGDGSVV